MSVVQVIKGGVQLRPHAVDAQDVPCVRVCAFGGGRRTRYHAAADARQAAQKRHGPGIAVAYRPAIHERAPGGMRRGGREVIGNGAAQQVVEIPFPGEIVPLRPGGQAARQMHQLALAGRIHAILRHNGHGLLRLIRRIADAVRTMAQGAQLGTVRKHGLHGGKGILIAGARGQLNALKPPQRGVVDQLKQLLPGGGQLGIIQHGIRRVGRGGLRQAGCRQHKQRQHQRRNPMHETSLLPCPPVYPPGKGAVNAFQTAENVLQ